MLGILRGRKRFVIATAVFILLAGAGFWIAFRGAPQPAQYSTATVRRGDLVATVTSTGTIEPEEVVDVGAQVVGIIQEFGRDPSSLSRPVDFGSVVEAGTILARIDDSIYRARVDKAGAQNEQAKATVAQAEADLHRAEANAKEAVAKANQAARDWGRIQKSFSMGGASEADYDIAQSAYEVTKAEILVTEAAIRQAKASLNAAQKTLLATEADKRETQRNLDYTIIRSPVKGVIVDRRVNVGQTVVSSLNAPSLFLIAKDLTRLQVWASVNEADIGRIRIGLPARFTVDAYPGDSFNGQVTQVRLNATMTQNVVTYTVVVTTDNSSNKLIPYLTATLQFETGRRTQTLLVPNAALRWQPVGESNTPSRPDQGIVWILEQGVPRPVEVKTGLTDGLMTEVSGDLQEGSDVIVGERASATASASTSPFTPNLFGGKR